MAQRLAVGRWTDRAFTDDLRGSPAIYAARRLVEAGHRVVAHDPAVQPSRALEAVPGIEICQTALEVFRGSDAVVVATDWPEFRELDLDAARQLARRPLLFDGRNLLDPQQVLDAGFEYRGVGRPRTEKLGPT